MSKSQIKRISIQRRIDVNSYVIVDRAVEEGVALGYMRSHKHTDNPDAESFKEHLHREVMNSLCEVLRFVE